jgi:hypothetical protein
VTAHWITPRWQPISAVLAVIELDESHTADYLGQLLENIITRMARRKNVVACTTDGAANMLKMTRNLVANKIVGEAVRCACHTLQLCVNAALEVPEAAGILGRANDLNQVALNCQRVRDELLKVQLAQVEEGKVFAPPPPEFDYPDYDGVEVRALRALRDVRTRSARLLASVHSATHCSCTDGGQLTARWTASFGSVVSCGAPSYRTEESPRQRSCFCGSMSGRRCLK